MAKINKDYYPQTPIYKDAAASGKKLNETNDCTIVALTVVTGKPYAQCKAALEKHGKKARRGCNAIIQEKALKDLGFAVQWISPQSFIDQYPEVHKRALKNVTNHHPDRFPQVFKDGKTYLFHNNSHVLAVVDGAVHDHSRGTRRQVKSIHEILPLKTRSKK